MNEKINHFFWKKYRPKTLDELILLPRIRSIINSDLNFIFYGSYGMGKTVLSKLLIKDHPNLKLNTSLLTSIDILRTEVSKFCKTYSFGEKEDEFKYVFFDEMDRASPEYQDALKGFVESNESKVRFIGTTNHIDKITNGLKSRFTYINFAPETEEERVFLKKEYAKRLLYISELENIQIDKKEITTIVNYNFPDMRKMVTILQEIKTTGSVSKNLMEDTDLIDSLYSVIFDSELTHEKNFTFIHKTMGIGRIENFFKMIGSDFIEHILYHKSEYASKISTIMDIANKCIYMKDTHIDPCLLIMDTIHKINKTIFNS